MNQDQQDTSAMEVLPKQKPPPLKRIMSLRDLWDVWVGLKGDVAPRTKDKHRSIGNYFCTFMEGRKLEPMTMVELVQSHLKRGTIGNNKINEYNIWVKGFLRWLKKMQYIHDDLWEAVPSLPKEAVAKPEIFTEDEFNRIKEYCTGRDWAQPHLWLAILGYRTGMSLVDCCHLRWRDVHLNENGPSFIDIYRIKTKRLGEKALCQIPIIPFTDVHEWLIKLKKVPATTQWHQNWITHYDDMVDFVHQDCPGLYMYPFPRISKDFERIFKEAKCGKGKTFRHLRNTFCSNLVNSGTQMALICKMTGHNNVQTLLGYLKADREALEDGLNKAFNFAKEGTTT